MTEQEWTDLKAKIAGHTPGPWLADEADMFGDHTITRKGEISAVAAVVSNCRPPEEVAANAALVEAAPTLVAEVERLRAENARLRGLAWIAYNEFNGIRARSGSANDVMDEYWSLMTDALGEACGDTSPWPTPEARVIIDAWPDITGSSQ